MTKKITTTIISAVLILSLSACTGSEIPSETPTPDIALTPEVTVEPAITPEPEAEQTPEVTVTPETEETPEPDATTAPTETTAPTPTPEIEQASITTADIWSHISTQIEFPSMMDGSTDDIASLYGIDSSLLKDYVLKTPMMSVTASEVFIAEVAAEDMDSVKASITTRKQNLMALWSEYLPEQYQLVSNAKIVTQGNYIIFAVSEEADSIVNLFTTALLA